jgi:hypothetical protein
MQSRLSQLQAALKNEEAEQGPQDKANNVLAKSLAENVQQICQLRFEIQILEKLIYTLNNTPVDFELSSPIYQEEIFDVVEPQLALKKVPHPLPSAFFLFSFFFFFFQSTLSFYNTNNNRTSLELSMHCGKIQRIFSHRCKPVDTCMSRECTNGIRSLE